MTIDWQDFGAAFALYLVFEGVVPFLSPRIAQRTYAAMAAAPAAHLRGIALASMAAGCALLYLIRS